LPRVRTAGTADRVVSGILFFMIRWTLTAYCPECGYDLAESDDDDLESLAEALEIRAETVMAEHILNSKCEG
jgi:hypothetical protein